MSEPVQGRGRGMSVELQELTKYYGDVCAVDRVTLSVKPGEFLALLGPSGSGKTTILMCIAGFEEPTKGRVLIGDEIVNGVPPHKRGLGVVFQRYALFPHMTVADNVAFPLRMRRLEPRAVEDEVADALTLVRMGGYGQRMPGQLSGGQQQRVAMARATVYRPPVLLMDEPLGALDRKLREAMQLELRQLQRELGLTVVHVTHDQGEALAMADRVAVLNDGHLEQVDVPEVLYERPATRFVADFVGETNFLEGRLITLDPAGGTIETLGGYRFRASRESIPASIATGSAVELGIRPERIKLDPAASGVPAPTGTVIGIAYAGPSATCLLELASHTRILARVPTGEAYHQWQLGAAATVTWRPEDVRVFARQDGGLRPPSPSVGCR